VSLCSGLYVSHCGLGNIARIDEYSNTADMGYQLPQEPLQYESIFP
jgi:hypothetical protein